MKRSVSWLVLAVIFGWQHTAAAETLIVKISGLHKPFGTVRIMLWKEAAGFPTQPDKAVAQKSAPVSGPEVELSFTGLSRGNYAAAAYHDQNNNGSLDRSLLGWPVEPTAASNGARGLVGPPSFSDAAFDLKQAVQTIQLIFK
ncbi:hypothetical protein GMST_18660 [Geomonas silvestris]|uniref:DUF2141 domain-containing protein n=1 Tax=Geomonas silvestris TaxID=2740184 RepID=A0A6V8MHR3_9BACT|nr:DUF2141 domain-containing protein [Geomonas silvestris]GFO59541.1 hypothetical protein GMST_18660 [Geomonas silvestris]